ncbi:hypothetical protein GSY74_08115 [Sulfurovum sp. bin170]|uniref:hypothetical protein n=1 Tax=Sulfurovum sp. bin170 TaxID=2695268 RepID=UPI0013DE9C9C|nr:hypothetical protein [Sulfurovum sp. bin170]NEW61246.1 hypothetical protein [Sulfurovum sp. bin170]
MGIKKFIEKTKKFLELDELEKSSKKKSIKSLLKKLYEREDKINKSLEKELDKKEKKQLIEELDIVAIHIKNGKKILDKLNT